MITFIEHPEEHPSLSLGHGWQLSRFGHVGNLFRALYRPVEVLALLTVRPDFTGQGFN